MPKTCTNGEKIAYRSEKAAKRMRNLRSKDAGFLRVYRCPYCYLWHLTHQR